MNATEAKEKTLEVLSNFNAPIDGFDKTIDKINNDMITSIKLGCMHSSTYLFDPWQNSDSFKQKLTIHYRALGYNISFGKNKIYISWE